MFYHPRELKAFRNYKGLKIQDTIERFTKARIFLILPSITVPQHEKRHLSERNGGVKLALSSHLRNFTTHLRHVKRQFKLCVKLV